MTFISVNEDFIGQSSNAETTMVSRHGYLGKQETIMETNTQQPYFEILDVLDWEAWKAKILKPHIG